MPPLGTARQIEPGILIHEVTLSERGGPSKLWIYLPERSTTERLPCVLIAPAGSRLFHGMALGEGDRPEHLPYVRAGFAVVAYEIDGVLGDHPDDQEVIAAAQAFRNADAGLANARAALDYALAKIPNIDPGRLYTTGHSSAATLSLLVAEHERRVAACVAYAPVCDLANRLGDRVVEMLSRVIPDYGAFVHRSSPLTNVADLRCPLFLFHADDDTNVPTGDIEGFAAELHKTNPNVRFVRVPQGGHYESMIRQGVPQAVEWLKALSAKSSPR